MGRSCVRLASPLIALALAALAACGDSTDPGPPTVEGTFVAAAVGDDPLPVVVRCSGFGACVRLLDAQLRFRSRGRVIDVRRFRDYDAQGEPLGDARDVGAAYAYHRLRGDTIVITRPFADTAYADTGVVVGDTIRLNVRKLEPDFGGIGSGRGPVVRYVRRPEPQP